ncbi:uncharacterized protein TNCV_1821291 [Trichonephila clavipes]|nr:uncharacterized protein TNCV_1821291 [Trichonephila clavipes]
MSDHPDILKQLALLVIDAIPLDAVKNCTDGSKGETYTTGCGVLIEIPGRINEIQTTNAEHASVFRTVLIAIIFQISPICIYSGLADDLAKVAASDPGDPEDHMVLTSTKINYRTIELVCRTWVQRHPGSTKLLKSSRSYQTIFSQFSTGHLRWMNFEDGKRVCQFAPNVTLILFLLITCCNVWGFPVRRLFLSPTVLILCEDL